MPERIPAGITRKHTLEAISDFERGKPHKFADSTRYDLLHKGKRFPPKAILGLAAAYVAGEPLKPSDFSGGEDSKCFRVLRDLGFEIVEKPDAAPPQTQSTQRRSSSKPARPEGLLAFMPANENEYRRWLRKHSTSGCVGNMHAHKVDEYFVLHKGTCHSITPGSSRSNAPGAFTEHDYRKVVGPDRESVLAWAIHRGYEPHVPRLCNLCSEDEELPPSEVVEQIVALGAEPLVLVQNERTAGGLYDHWIDVEGERFQFPNQYRNKIRAGRPFVYYRGTRRKVGRGQPDYFGWGRIGEVQRDPSIPEDKPAQDWKWFCEIEDYESFPSPVPWTRPDDGSKYEQLHKNQWGVAAREISPSVFLEILSGGGVAIASQPPLLSKSDPALADNLIAPTKPSQRKGASKSPRRRWSKESKRIGDAGERIVFDYLRDIAPSRGWSKVRWVADEGETPGWDIEYCNVDGVLQAVEVKATTGPRFQSIEVTANEWARAEELRERYWIYLVADVRRAPKIQPVCDPFGRLLAEGAILTPTTYRLEWTDREQ